MPGPTGDCVCCEATCIVAIDNVPAPACSRPLFDTGQMYDPVPLRPSGASLKWRGDSNVRAVLIDLTRGVRDVAEPRRAPPLCSILVIRPCNKSIFQRAESQPIIRTKPKLCVLVECSGSPALANVVGKSKTSAVDRIF